MRVVWCSWISVSETTTSDVQIFTLRDDSPRKEIEEAVGAGRYAFFFEPTPQPGLSHDPITLARRLARMARRPARTVAFVTNPSPTPLETQFAFAAQVGMILGVTPQVRTVEIPGMGPFALNTQTKAKTKPDLEGSLDPGPTVDWLYALRDAADPRSESLGPLPKQPQLFARLYLTRARKERKFGVTGRELLHVLAAGGVPVRADELARRLGRQRETVQRAITAVARDFPAEGRSGPEVVGQLVYSYGWFLRMNRP